MFLLLFLFSYVSGQKLTSKIYLVAILTNLLYSISFSAIPNSLFSYLIGPTYSLIFAWIIGKFYTVNMYYNCKNIKDFLWAFSDYVMEFDTTFDNLFYISLIWIWCGKT